ncbi:hypothetical protein [Alloalcanivorax sp. C16-1]|uniref:hypothetical protein n=1 Tax=Alloalcanivorax sp. C16-1 TaxID=3390051 RepID=UPI003970528D
MAKNKIFSDEKAGCTFQEMESVPGYEKIRLCKVSIQDVMRLSAELAASVQDTSWIMDLDERARRAYRKTAQETAEILVKIFNEISEEEVGVGAELGELIVSMGSSKALGAIFSHHEVPLAELWKPQKKQNEGFDFHTVCPFDLVNFGEAKFKSSSSPYSEAIKQAKSFIGEEKHLRDGVHLGNFVSKNAIDNLDCDLFGVVAAFSLNAKDEVKVMNNALKKILEDFDLGEVEAFYLVGVAH